MFHVVLLHGILSVFVSEMYSEFKGEGGNSRLFSKPDL